MELKGECKKKFNEWYLWIYLDLENVGSITTSIKLSEFYDKNTSEQYGVYVDFFERLKIRLNIHYNAHHEDYEVFIGNRFRCNATTRKTAREEAISREDEILSKRPNYNNK